MYIPAQLTNLDEFLFAPVVHGYWRHEQTFDGTFNLSDLLDIHEVISWDLLNKQRAREAEEYMANIGRG